MLDLPFDPPIVEVQLPHTPSLPRVYMKREDLFDTHISGNKWRKLKYVLHDAKQQNKTHVVSFGGAYSNHLVALAEAAHRYGFAATAFVRGELVSNQMLDFCRQRNMKLIFVPREAYKDKHGLYNKYFCNHTDTYFIDEGGRGELAAKGCEEILDKTPAGFTHVICAVGTGTTLAGLARAAYNKQIIPEGICVLKGAQSIDIEVKKMTNKPLHIHHSYSRRGYAKTDAQLLVYMNEFAQQNGFELDKVYTAKMCMAVSELIKTKYYQPSHQLLLIHTGGLLGND
jgi:1-aminocyclopropane-1-carboxylate deaminase